MGRARTMIISERWLDPALAAVLLIAYAVDVAGARDRHGPLALNLLLVAAITIPTAWRRRAPLAFASVVMVLAIVMDATLTSVTSHVVPLYLLFLPPYTVAVHEARGRALAGLVVCLVGAGALDAVSSTGAGDYLFTAGMSTASWTVGRALRARRLLNEELQEQAQRLAAERETRERLAIADERTRIARELHAIVAGSVSAMVVQTEVAQQLLDQDPDQADAAMAAVEDAGRQTLAEMRRILGVLRRPDAAAELAPQPGVGQIHGLVERARQDGREIELEVQGDPGALPASVDLGLYRILEEALATAAAGRVEVRLGFPPGDVALEIDSPSARRADWPTLAMRERVALCAGELRVDGGRLHVRLPRVFEEAPG